MIWSRRLLDNPYGVLFEFITSIIPAQFAQSHEQVFHWQYAGRWLCWWIGQWIDDLIVKIRNDPTFQKSHSRMGDIPFATSSSWPRRICTASSSFALLMLSRRNPVDVLIEFVSSRTFPTTLPSTIGTSSLVVLVEGRFNNRTMCIVFFATCYSLRNRMRSFCVSPFSFILTPESDTKYVIASNKTNTAAYISPSFTATPHRQPQWTHNQKQSLYIRQSQYHMSQHLVHTHFITSIDGIQTSNYFNMMVFW